MRHGRGKSAGVWELYDLARDIGETNNLAEAERERREELEAIWNNLDDEMVEPAFR